MHIDAVRRFNRFYTRRIGVLRGGLLGSPYRLTEARLLYELAQGGQATASALGRDLGLDLGYLSLPEQDRARLVGAMKAVETVLGGEKKEVQVLLREHRPGDLGWIVHRHGALYAEEYGWDERFEALVAGIVARFVKHFDAARERCWIAEIDGERVGAVLVVKQSRSTAKLRLLIVEPGARGRGLGRRLVEECIAFARAKGYRKLVLWTQSNLAAARAIYKQCGFRRVRKERHSSFGYDLVGEFWQLAL